MTAERTLTITALVKGKNAEIVRRARNATAFMTLGLMSMSLKLGMINARECMEVQDDVNHH